jgi:putative heme-binding domain-containing protein
VGFCVLGAFELLIESIGVVGVMSVKSVKRRIIQTVVVAIAVNAVAVLPVRADSAVPAIMNLLKSGRLPKERLGTVVELVCKQGNAEDLGYIYEQTLKSDAFTNSTRVSALENLAKATISRKVKPKGDLAGLAKLIRPGAAKERRGLQIAAMRLCGLWKVKAASDQLQQVALSETAKIELRRAAIDSLMQVGGKTALATAEKLAGSKFPKPLRYLAVAGMAELDLDKATSSAVGVLQETKTDDDPSALFAAFLDHRAGPDKLAAAIASAKIPIDAARLGLRYMYSIGRSDAALSAALSKAAGIDRDAKPLTEKEIQQLSGEVLTKGDAKRGEEVFRRVDVSCMKCHAISKAGGDVGPDLSALGSSSPIDYVVKSILFPNQAIKEQYRAAVVITVEGKVFTGIVKDRNGERIVLKEATGRERTIAIDDIEEEEEGKSLMPQGLTKFLSHQDLVDLVRFLSLLGKPGPYAIRTTPTIQRWRTLRPVPRELLNTVPDDASFPQAVLENESLVWISAYGMVEGTLPLNELATQSRSTVLYLQGEVNVTETGRVVFRLNNADGLHAWIDDEAFGSESSIETNLSRGRHLITLRIDTKKRNSRELKVEVVKAEDSEVEFTVVGGR